MTPLEVFKLADEASYRGQPIECKESIFSRTCGLIGSRWRAEARCSTLLVGDTAFAGRFDALDVLVQRPSGRF